MSTESLEQPRTAGRVIDPSSPHGVAARLRAGLVALAVAAGGVSETLFLAWHGPYDPQDFPIDYDAFVPIRDAWLNTHYYGGIGIAVFMIGLAVAACMLTPARGAIWTTVGAAMITLGGIAHLAGIAGEGVAMGYAADPAAVPQAQGAELLRYIFEHDGRFFVGIGVGLLLMTLGGILIGVGLVRARTVPLWVPLTLIASTIAMPIMPFQYVWLASAITALISIVIAWYAWRTRTPASTTP